MSAEVHSERIVAKCRYCTVDGEFRPLVAYKSGRYVCPDCSHQERPLDPDYRCSCPRCLKLVMGLGTLGTLACDLPHSGKTRYL